MDLLITTCHVHAWSVHKFRTATLVVTRRKRRPHRGAGLSGWAWCTAFEKMPLFTKKDAEEIRDPHGPHLSLWSTLIPTRQFTVKALKHTHAACAASGATKSRNTREFAGCQRHARQLLAERRGAPLARNSQGCGCMAERQEEGRCCSPTANLLQRCSLRAVTVDSAVRLLLADPSLPQALLTCHYDNVLRYGTDDNQLLGLVVALDFGRTGEICFKTDDKVRVLPHSRPTVLPPID